MISRFFVNVGALVFARAFTAVSQVLVLPILARYVPVEDFAIMALAMTVVLFSNILSDAGLGRSLIRTPQFDAQEWSSVFWFLVGIGGALLLGVLIVAPVWSWAFEQERLLGILAALSVVPLLNAASAVHNAAIERDEQHTKLSLIQIPTTIVSLIVATVLAVQGYGVWALVWQQIVLTGGRLGGLLLVSPFRPLFVFDWHHVRPHLKFARDALSVSGIHTLGKQMPVIAIGRFLGEAPLGYFAMSQRFTRLPHFGLAGPASAVVYVRLAKAQHDHQLMANIYIAAMRTLAFVLVPPLLMIAAASDAIFTVLLTREWAPTAAIFSLSIPGLTLDAVAAVCLGALFRARGETGLHLRFVFESTIVLVVLVFLAALFSVEMVAFAFTVWAAIVIPRGWLLARTIVPLSISECSKAVALPLCVTLLVATLFRVLVSAVQPGNWLEIALAILGTLIAMGAIAILAYNKLRLDLRLFRA